MIKTIFIDIDGTLTNKYGKIPTSAIDAINAARVKGHSVFLCSGRSKVECQPIIRKVGVDGIIGGGGSYIEVKSEVIMEKFFSSNETRALIDYLSDKKIGFYLSSPDFLYIDRTLNKKLKKVGFLFPAKFKKRIKLIDSLNDVEIEKISKINFINRKISLEKISSDLIDNFSITPSTIAAFGKGSGEIMPPHTSKKIGIDYLVSHLNILKSDTIGIGNGLNDIDMFRAVGLKVAVKDADPRLKEIADYIADKPMKDGIFKLFSWLEII
ncbi:Cof-type HAD-IIB family hydrolase [Listeria monocytogenes]|uniref:Cof-type HAD-IIB family hydrolase n=1 Tax=Listeria monocytogenes TaxID=1639 RepID=UPI0015C7EE58|nr:Cof-type HAD-IIB family hydrolase [Listeria monocytogenes]